MRRSLLASRRPLPGARSAVVPTRETTSAPGAARPSAQDRAGVTVFTEARFGRGAHGGWLALHRAEVASIDRFRRAGRAVTVVARADPSRVYDGVPVEASIVPLPYYVGVRQLVRALPRLVPAVTRAAWDADSIVLRLPGMIGSLAGTACRLTGRRYAAEIVGEPVAALRAGVAGRLGSLLAGAVGAYIRWVVAGASSTTYVTAEALQRLYPPGRGAVSAAISDIRLDPAELLSTPQVPPDGPPRLVTIGHQDQNYKGHDVLLRAVAMLRAEGIAVEATIVGGGRLHEKLCALRDDLGLQGSVVLTGTVNDRSELARILDGAAVFVLPSLTEGLPRALIEGMARGLPAVGTTVGGIPELLDAECLVPPGDAAALAGALRTVLTDGEFRRRQAERNLEVARSFDATSLERRWVQWVDGIPRSRRSTGS